MQAWSGVEWRFCGIWRAPVFDCVRCVGRGEPRTAGVGRWCPNQDRKARGLRIERQQLHPGMDSPAMTQSIGRRSNLSRPHETSMVRQLSTAQPTTGGRGPSREARRLFSVERDFLEGALMGQ